MGRTPLAKCSGREGGKARDAGRGERTAGQPSCEAIKVEGRGGRHVLQARLGQPTVACLAQAERAHALRERTLDPLTLGIKLTAARALQAGPGGRQRLVSGRGRNPSQRLIPCVHRGREGHGWYWAGLNPARIKRRPEALSRVCPQLVLS